MMPLPRRAIAALLGLALFGIYNLNGREMHNYDSRATKLAAVALASRGTMTLDLEVAETPVLASYGPFQVDRQGHFRSAYSPVAALFGAAAAWTLSATGVVQLDAPFAPILVATVTASAVTSLAVCLVFLTLTRLVSPGVALAVAVGLGLGTNFWIVNARTLGQQEVVALGLAMCVFAWTRRPEDLRQAHLWAGGRGPRARGHLPVSDDAPRLRDAPRAVLASGPASRHRPRPHRRRGCRRSDRDRSGTGSVTRWERCHDSCNCSPRFISCKVRGLGSPGSGLPDCWCLRAAAC